MGNLLVKKENSTIHNVTPIDDISFGISDQSDSGKKGTESKLPPLESSLPPDTRSPNNLTIVVALYTYEARDEGDLSFRKGDRLGILDDSDADWWLVCHLPETTEGVIPRHYVAPENTLESEDWFFGNVSREYAENVLMIPSNPTGTFLIRCKEQTASITKGVYILSTRDWTYEKSDHVKHYKLKATDDGGFCVSVRKTFVTLQELVAYYSEDAYDKCHKLTIPCPNKPKPHLWDLSLSTRNEWEISWKSLKLIQKLGSGDFGDVYYGKWKVNTEVAIRIARCARLSPDAFLKVASVMKKLRHEKLVSVYAVCSKEEPFLIVTEYMINGSLLDYLRNREGKNLRLCSLIDMAAQIASGMACLEREQLIHQDLAARNILVGERNVVKVADFGLARIVKDSEFAENQGAKFLLKWTAPEAALLGRFSIKSDVWSYGIVLFELITYGRFPYPDMGDYRVLEQVERGYRMPKPTNCNCPDSVYSMMLQCWNADPEKRPTFEFLFVFFDDYTISTETIHHDVRNFRVQ